jgi:hypothetical protein
MAMVGVAYRPEFAAWIDSRPPMLDCLEITAEQFFLPSEIARLPRLADGYPLMVHGVGLSLGTPGPLDNDTLDAFADVVRIADPLWVSEHIAFSKTAEVNLGHFNPVRPDAETIDTIAAHVQEIKARCGKPVVLENITTSLRIPGTLKETEFLNRLCEVAECGLLLDVTNLLVNARNHGFDPRAWLGDIDPEHIVQFHVVGYTHREERYYDSHENAIQDDLWSLIRDSLAYGSPKAVIIERDRNFPPIDEIEHDLGKLKAGC